MGNISRRDFLAMAAVLGAEAAWGRSFAAPSKISWRERRDLFLLRNSLAAEPRRDGAVRPEARGLRDQEQEQDGAEAVHFRSTSL